MRNTDATEVLSGDTSSSVSETARFNDDPLLQQADLLYSLSDIDQALAAMASRISADLADKNPLAIGVMNGALVTMGHLLPKLDCLLEVDYCHATRYGNDTSGGEIQWLALPQKSLAGRVVLLIDDIFDQGVTLKHIAEYCLAQGASEVKTAVLLDKKHDRKVEGFSVDYSAIDIVDRYVFGFGLDYKGLYRNAPGVFAISE